MSDTVIVAGFAFLGVLVTVFGSVMVAKIGQVHDLANSNLAAANARLDTALAKIEALKDIISAKQGGQ